MILCKIACWAIWMLDSVWMCKFFWGYFPSTRALKVPGHAKITVTTWNIKIIFFFACRGTLHYVCLHFLIITWPPCFSFWEFSVMEANGGLLFMCQSKCRPPIITPILENSIREKFRIGRTEIIKKGPVLNTWSGDP